MGEVFWGPRRGGETTGKRTCWWSETNERQMKKFGRRRAAACSLRGDARANDCSSTRDGCVGRDSERVAGIESSEGWEKRRRKAEAFEERDGAWRELEEHGVLKGRRTRYVAAASDGDFHSWPQEFLGAGRSSLGHKPKPPLPPPSGAISLSMMPFPRARVQTTLWTFVTF